MATSYNGWPASSDPKAIGVDSGFRGAGVAFPGGCVAGDVSKVLGYVADQLAARVEPLMTDPATGKPGYGSWGWNYRANVNNPSQLSNHASGTAIDWAAPRHPNGSRGTFSSAQVATIRQILAECSGVVYWGGDYSGTPDEMHFEINAGSSAVASAAAKLPSGQGEWDNMDQDTFNKLMNAWYRDSLVVELNNGETTTNRQFNKNLDERTYTSERAAKVTLGEPQ